MNTMLVRAADQWRHMDDTRKMSEVQRMVGEKKTDAEMGAVLGVNGPTITRYRSKHGLKTILDGWLSVPLEDRKREMRELIDAGFSRQEIVSWFGTISKAIVEFCGRHDIAGLPGEQPTTMWESMSLQERVDEVELMAREGATSGAIGKSMDVSASTIKVFCGEHDILLRESDRIRVPPVATFPVADPVDPIVWQPIGGSSAQMADNTGCSWPVDTPEGQRCCGVDIHKRSYCARHYAIAYRPARQIGKATTEWLSNVDNKGKPSARQMQPRGEKKEWSKDDE